MGDPIRVGIFGWPVAHSKSPQMHEAAARALGIALRYERFAVEPERLSAAIHKQHAAGIDGYNVTVPHKEAVMPLLEEVSSHAQAIGAVNTVVRTEGRYVGHNTDAPGFVRSLEDADVSIAGAHVTVVGAGGAARAGVVGLAVAGAASIVVLSRRLEQAAELTHALNEHAECILEHGTFSDASSAFAKSDLLVQATSATLESNPDAAAFAEGLPLESLPEHATVVDMVYRPLRTTVLARAAERGLKTVDGLGMLLHQGAIAFEMWTGVEPPLDVMRAALEP